MPTIAPSPWRRWRPVLLLTGLAGLALITPVWLILVHTTDFLPDGCRLWLPTYLSWFIGGMMLVTDTPPGALEPLLTRALAEVDPNLTINSVRTMRKRSPSRLTGDWTFVKRQEAASSLLSPSGGVRR